MDYLVATLPTLAENLALDEALLLRAEAEPNREILRLWEWPAPAVVLGAAGVLAEEVDAAACNADAVPIARRSSGGGTVMLGQGCLLFSVVLAFDRAAELRQIGSSYCWILERLCTAMGITDLRPAGISDLAVGDRKVSGNAQQRKRHHLLHHGSLLYAFDGASLGRYLRQPPRQPPYRRQREHAEFVGNLPLGREKLVSGVRQAFGAEREIDAWPAETVRRLVEEKYSQSEWIRRR
jgi:lipoate-protein ligase A